MSGAVSLKPKAPFKPTWATELPDGTVELGLPEALHTRAGAVMLMEAVLGDLAGRTVLLDGRATRFGSATFADELLAQLSQRKVAEVLLTPTAAEFEAALTVMAAARGLTLRSARLNGDPASIEPFAESAYC